MGICAIVLAIEAASAYVVYDSIRCYIRFRAVHLLNCDQHRELSVFLSFPSALMVVGGTLAATLIGQEARYVWLALRRIVRIFMVQRVGRHVLNHEVGRIMRWGYLVRSGGVLASRTRWRRFKSTNFYILVWN